MPTLTLIILTKVGKNIAYDITPNKTSYVIGNGTFIYSSLVVCMSDTFPTTHYPLDSLRPK